MSTRIWVQKTQINTNLDTHTGFVKQHRKVTHWVTWLRLSHVLKHFCPECCPFFFFLFFTPIDEFLPPCESACSQRERRVPQHGEQMARPSRDGRLEKKKQAKKKRLAHWDSHWDPAEHSTQSPNESDRGECVSECVYLCLVSCVSACTCQSCSHALVCVMRQTKFGWTPHKHTVRSVFVQSGSSGGLLCFSSLNKCLMDSPRCMAAVRRGWQSLAADDRRWLLGYTKASKQLNPVFTTHNKGDISDIATLHLCFYSATENRLRCVTMCCRWVCDIPQVLKPNRN